MDHRLGFWCGPIQPQKCLLLEKVGAYQLGSNPKRLAAPRLLFLLRSSPCWSKKTMAMSVADDYRYPPPLGAEDSLQRFLGCSGMAMTTAQTPQLESID